jgi:hypothetical protein
MTSQQMRDDIKARLPELLVKPEPDTEKVRDGIYLVALFECGFAGVDWERVAAKWLRETGGESEQRDFSRLARGIGLN